MSYLTAHVCILLILNVYYVRNSNLNVPRILLPVFKEASTNFYLEASEDGCYKWSANPSNLLEITPTNEDETRNCATAVQIHTTTNELKRQLIVIFAENVETKQILRCDVTLDQISSLKIQTITKELYLDEAPEKFEVIAYDLQGNAFSTLENIEFKWSTTSAIKSNEKILRFLKFTTSGYKTPTTIANLERSDKMGSIVLLEGIKTGSAKLTVSLPYEEYSHINASEVDLLVIANIVLNPQQIFMMPGDMATLKTFFMKNGSLHEFSLRDSQYHLTVENSQISTVQPKTGVITALKEGKTVIHLHDKLLSNDQHAHLPSIEVFVQNPEYISLNIVPNNNWAVLVGDHYEIQLEIYSKYQQLHIGPQVQITMNVIGEFSILERTSNGSWISGYGIKPCVVSIDAHFNGILSESVGKIGFAKEFRIKKELFVYPQIHVIPNLVVLPWDSLIMPKYEIQVIAKGGDGKFLFTSTNHDIGMVSQTGLVKTRSSGYFEVAVTMMRNHNNQQFAQFVISPPTRLEILDYLLESEIGQTLYLNVALYANYQDRNGNIVPLPFTKCDELPLHVKHNSHFQYNRSDVLPSIGVSCTNVAIVPLHIGSTDVTVSYYYNELIFEDTVHIHSFEPLVLLEPKQEIVLAVGSSVNLIFSGGPRPIQGYEHERIVQIDSKIVAANDESTKHNLTMEDVTVVEVVCLQLGETTLRLSISNKCYNSKCHTRSSSFAVKINCAKPYKMFLIEPQSQMSNLNVCPMNFTEDSAVVRSEKDLKLELVMFDECNSKFLNVSSLDLKWTVTPKKAAQILNQNDLFIENLTYGAILIPLRLYQTLKLTTRFKEVIVDVAFLGYKSKVLKYHGIKSVPEYDRKTCPIVANFTLFVTNQTGFSRNDLILYNHPNNRRVIEILNGSNHFEIDIKNRKLANINISNRKIEIQPLHSGIMHIKVYDLCMLSEPPAILQINIVSVGIVRVEMVDKVEIGKCVSSIVRLYDENDHLIIVPELNMISIRTKFAENCAEIQRDEEKLNQLELGEIHYLIKGVDKCDTTLVFTVISGNEEVSSAPVFLQIFEPIKLSPNNYTALINVLIQFMVIGGPTRDIELLFNSENNDTVYVNEKGLMLAKHVGKTRITLKAVGFDPTDGAQVIYSETFAEVNVILLQDVRIAAPLTRFQVGSTVLFWCYGIPNISPLTLGSIQDPNVHFLWRVDDNILVEVYNVFYTVGIDSRRVKKLSIRASGLQPGVTELNLHVSILGAAVGRPNERSVTLSTRIEIEVVPEFHLIKPISRNEMHFLMAPNSEMQIETNLDKSYSVLSYSLLNSVSTVDVLTNQSVDGMQLISLSSDGLIKSGTSLGHASIEVVAKDQLGMKQNIIFIVEVKKIHYMHLMVKAHWRLHSSTILEFIPLGTIFYIQAVYQDSLGNRFHAGPKELKVRLNRCDLIEIQKSNEMDATIEVKTIRSGFTVMKFWVDGIEKTVDYIKIHVKQSVKPVVGHLTSGDIICMSTPVIDEHQQPGHWRSSDPTLVAINPALDAGFVGNRDGLVILTHSLLPAAQLPIRIHRVSHIEFLTSTSNLKLSNGKKNEVVRYVLVLQSEKSKDVKTNNLIQGWRCRVDIRKLLRPKGFKCFMTFLNSSLDTKIEEIFGISTSWVPETGQYACKLIDQGINNVNISVIRSEISVWATTEDGDIESARLTIRFIPSFYVKKEVALLDDRNEAYMDVIGLPEVLNQLEVKVADDKILNVNRGYLISETQKRYVIELIDYHWRLAELADILGVIVTSKLTGQEERVIVTVSRDIKRQLCTMARPSFILLLIVYKNIIVMVVSILLVALPTIYFYSSYVTSLPESPNRCEYGDGTVITCRRNLEINSKYSVVKSSSSNLSRDGVRFFGNVKSYDGHSLTNGDAKWGRRSSVFDINSKVQDM